MRPYLHRVLDTPLNWSVHSTGLFVRALLEFETYSTSDKAAIQLGALADAAERSAHRLSVYSPRSGGGAEGGDGTAAPPHRLSHAPALFLPSVWELKRELGERYMRLGAIRDALAVFSALELWEEVLTCLRLLERPRKALATVRLLRASVENDPSAVQQLACYMTSSAALRDSDEEFAEAWRVSGGRYAPAALALGRRLGARGEWARAETFLRAGLKVAPGDAGGWFLLGVVGMRTGDLEGGAAAFSRTVQLDATRSDAWSNLGSIYLHGEQWAKGYAALEQALKADKEDWRILSNFVTSAVRVGSYSRAISAMGQLLSLAVRGGKTGEEGQAVDMVGEGGLHLAALTSVARQVLDSFWERRRSEVHKADPSAAAAPTAAPALDSSSAFDPQGGLPFFPPIPVGSLDEEEEEKGKAGAGGAQKPQAEAGGVDPHAFACLEPLARLLESITGSMRPPATVWAIYADVEEARGRLSESQACRERQWRSLLAVANWEREEAPLKAVVECTQRLLAVGAALRDLGIGGRSFQAWEEQARYYKGTVHARVEAASGGLVGHTLLSALPRE
jgi:tetratricopeptide (TPR) repeat protein